MIIPTRIARGSCHDINVTERFQPTLAERVQMLIPPMLWDHAKCRDHAGEKVVLLHGLWRSRHAMEPLARRLESEGFCTLNIPYASSRQPLDRITREIRDQVREFAGEEPVHFVTHSLGGIIARILIAESPPWKQGRLVMMAPPNGGSEIIDWISRKPLLRALIGPAGRSLSTDGIPSQLPALPQGLEAIAIMGNRATIPFFTKLLGAENDGIVSAERGRLDGLRGFSVIGADHTFIQIHPDAVRQTLAFLKNGASALASAECP